MYKALLSLIAAIVVSAPAFAADIDPARFSQSQDFTWTGLYLGASLGMADAHDTQDNFPIAPNVTIQLYSEGEHKAAGLFVGYMHQMGSFVVGAEYQRIDTNIQYISEFGPLPIYLDQLDQVKGRLGYAMGQVLLYGVAGGTYGTINAGLLEDWTAMVGGGIDFALDKHLIVGAEYSHSFFDEFDGEPISGAANYLSGRLTFKF